MMSEGAWRVEPPTPGNSVPIEAICLAGIPVPVRLVVELARLLHEAEFHETAERLERGWAREERMVSLPDYDREALLWVLLDGPREFATLRAVMIWDHVRRRAAED